MSQCSACSLACVSSSPPALCTSALGVPVVPDENNTDSGSSKGSRCRTGSAPVSPAAGAAPSQARQDVATPGAATSRPGYGSTTTEDRKSTRLNSSHVKISYAVFCLKKKNTGLT